MGPALFTRGAGRQIDCGHRAERRPPPLRRRLSHETTRRPTNAITNNDPKPNANQRETRNLVRAEPPKEFGFTVSRTPSNQYNLTCHAGPTFPRPTLALYRYRAGQLEAQSAGGEQQQQPPLLSAGRAHRPRLAATRLRQEPLAGTQTQLTISAASQQAAARLPPAPLARISLATDSADVDLTPSAELPLAPDEMVAATSTSGHDTRPLAPPVAGAYEISAWALVDEASLSANLVSQFECVLSIEGTQHEQRQSLALQKGEFGLNSSGMQGALHMHFKVSSPK